jgi:hypothetical protein
MVEKNQTITIEKNPKARRASNQVVEKFESKIYSLNLSVVAAVEPTDPAA